jgi:Amidohydrolase family
MEAMSPPARQAYLYWRNRPQPAQSNAAFLQRREMNLERAFVAAGGLLLAGPDPVGIGGNVPGFGDHREIELLVEAGFTPVQAIRIATLNGATFLGRENQIGSVAVGKSADLLVVKVILRRASRISRMSRSSSRMVSATTQKSCSIAAKGHYGKC